MNFPTSTVKSNGANFAQQNRKTGPFTGVISDIREIHSSTSPTVFGVVEIKVAGETDVFQDYLNFNPMKEEKSVSFLVAHCKAAARAAGMEVDPDEEKDMAWVAQTWESLKGKTVRFSQSLNANNQLNINYLS